MDRGTPFHLRFETTALTGVIALPTRPTELRA